MDEPDAGESENDRLTVLPYATPATPAASDGAAIIRRHVLMSAIAAFVVVGNLYLLGSGAMERFQAWMLVATDVAIAIGVPISFAAAKPGGIHGGVGCFFAFVLLTMAWVVGLFLSVVL